MLALILAAGKGTRLGKLTKDTPKCMVRVAGKPVLERQVEYLQKQGVNKIIVNLHYLPWIVMDHFGSRLLYFYEPILLGEESTEAIIAKRFNEPMVVMNGDTLTEVKLEDMFKFNQSVQYWDKSYRGIKYILDYKLPKKVDFKTWHIDMGTPEGLREAEKHYAGN